MRRYSEAAWERMMKVQEVILRAMAKRIRWWQAAEILEISDRSLRRWKRRYEQYGYGAGADARILVSATSRSERDLFALIRALVLHAGRMESAK